MTLVHKLNGFIQQKLSSQFLKNLGWLGLAEIAYRGLRLGLLVVTAQFLSRTDYGLGATILSVREFAITFCDVGVAAKVIQADEKELPELCNSAYWLNWVVFSSLFFVQCLAAFPVSWFAKTNDLILPICVSAIPFLIWPLAGINKNLIQRENRFHIIAITEITQNLIGVISCGFLIVSGLGVWAFVIPALIQAPIEAFLLSKGHSWRVSTRFTTKYWKEIFDFGKNILGVTFLRTLRNNLDNFIVIGFLGMEQFGIYSMGFNSGLGISLSVINAINSAILPHLCAERDNYFGFKKSYLKSLKNISFLIIPLVILQSSLAQFYVPKVFGERWIPAVPILVLICISAIPRAFADASSQLLVAVGKPHLNFRWNIIFTSIFTVSLLFAAQSKSIIIVAITVLFVHVICLPLFVIWATKFVFAKK